MFHSLEMQTAQGVDVMCRIPYTGEVQALDTKSFYVSATFLCAAKYLLNSVTVGFLQERLKAGLII